MISDMEKKSIPIKFYISQIEFEQVIIYANQHKILIPDLMRKLIYDNLDIIPYVEKPKSEFSTKKPIDIKPFNSSGMGEVF
jgi:hypothetical protein